MNRLFIKWILLLSPCVAMAQGAFLRSYPEINYPIEYKYPRQASIDKYFFKETETAFFGFFNTRISTNGINDTNRVQVVKFDKKDGSIIKQIVLPANYCRDDFNNVAIIDDKIHLFLYAVDISVYCGGAWIQSIDRKSEDYIDYLILDSDLNLLLNKTLRKDVLTINHINATSKGLELLGRSYTDYSFFKYEIDTQGNDISFRSYYPEFWLYDLFYDFKLKDNNYYINTGDTLFVTDTAYTITKRVKLGAASRPGKITLQNDKLYYHAYTSDSALPAYSFIETFDADLNRTDSTQLYRGKDFSIVTIGDNTVVSFLTEASENNSTIDYFLKTSLDNTNDVFFKQAYLEKDFYLYGTPNKTNDGGYIFGGFYFSPSGFVDFILLKTDCMGKVEWQTNDCAIAKSPQFELYPNPVSEYLNIHFSFYSEVQKIEFKIYDLLGKEIASYTEAFQSNIFLNLRGLNFGIYFYQLSLDGKVVGIGRFLKE